MVGETQQVLLQRRQVLLCRYERSAVRVPADRRLVLYLVAGARRSVFGLDTLQFLYMMIGVTGLWYNLPNSF